jgi:DNA mismatch repair protein MutL
MPIRTLSPLLVNQIAAGEVIERPASVVKEVVENAIDAGATRIDVAIEQGGRELIRISDNGCGIPLEELPLAIAPHATSKISTAEDLDAIATMGFRGEALASIVSVSRFSIVSRTKEQSSAGMIEAEGDRAKPPQPVGAPVGTTVVVRNLFFNTPARRKFLRGEQAESQRVVDVVENLALAQPAIAFTLLVDGKLRLELPPGQLPAQRALAILGEELAPELLELRSDTHGLAMWGMIGKPAVARGTARHQRLFLNGRMIVDRSLNHAIKEAYRGLLDPTRYPMVVLFISIDPAQVDVNVHPTKAEVRFRNQANVHGAVLSAVRQTLRQADLTPALELPAQPLRSWTESFRAGELPPASIGASRAAPPLTPEFGSGLPAPASKPAPALASFVEYFRRLDPHQKGFVYSEVKQALAADSPELLRDEWSREVASAAQAAPPQEILPVVRPVADVLQVHSSYIVTQDESGLVIIDQHALHERVMFEKLKARLERGSGGVEGGGEGKGEGTNLESQRLLMPAVVNVDPSQVAMLDDLKPLLTRIGIEAEPIGPNAIGVHAFTSLLFERGVDPAQFMTDLLDKAAARGLANDSEAALHETLDMMACKAAVKAGDKLAPEELAELLKYRHTVERSSNCPHGRPTTLRLSLKELDKQFGRS